MSDIAIDTPNASQTGVNKMRANKPDLYYSDQNKLDAWLLQANHYFHLEGDKIKDNDKVMLATSYFQGDAEK
jgi:hypothetical protein